MLLYNLRSFEAVKDRITFYMGQFNEYVRGFQMDLVFFRDAMVHLMIVSRILSMPRWELQHIEYAYKFNANNSSL